VFCIVNGNVTNIDVGLRGKTLPKGEAKGRLGGLKGGPARSAKMTPEKRREITQKAAKARWQK
jgi:hypothetical protein